MPDYHALDPNEGDYIDPHGILRDADGIPVPQALGGPPRECRRCGTLAEYASEFAAAVPKVGLIKGVQCCECYRLAQTDLRAWCERFRV